MGQTLKTNGLGARKVNCNFGESKKKNVKKTGWIDLHIIRIPSKKFQQTKDEGVEKQKKIKFKE